MWLERKLEEAKTRQDVVNVLGSAKKSCISCGRRIGAGQRHAVFLVKGEAGKRCSIPMCTKHYREYSNGIAIEAMAEVYMMVNEAMTRTELHLVEDDGIVIEPGPAVA